MENSDAWLMRAAFSSDLDWSLDALLKKIDDTGMVFPLTVLTGSVFIKGLAVPVDQWADHLDEAMDKLLGGAASLLAEQQKDLSAADLASVRASAGDVEKNRAEWVSQGWRNQVDERRARATEARSKLDALDEAPNEESGPFSSLPDDLAEAVVGLELPKRALTIKDATLLGLQGGSVTLPFVRVSVDHVAAWWPGGIDFGSADPSPDEQPGPS